MPRKASKVEVSDFIHSVGLLVRRIRAAAASQELSLSETSVLSRLSRSGRATTAELARAEGMRPQSMRSCIATLEELGLIQRKPHPTDGRQMNIELSNKGFSVLAIVKDARHTWLAQAMTALNDQERTALFSAGKIIQRLAESGPS